MRGGGKAKGKERGDGRTWADPAEVMAPEGSECWGELSLNEMRPLTTRGANRALLHGQ